MYVNSFVQVEHQLLVMEGMGCTVLGDIEELASDLAEVKGMPVDLGPVGVCVASL